MPENQDKSRQVIDQIWVLIEPVVKSEGFELIEIEYRRETQGWVLRLYIDRDEGVTVEDCARISHVVGDLMDVADPIENPYHLEVSSPGLDRPLRKYEHFHKYVGKVVKVRTTAPVEKRKKFKGILLGSTPEGITVDCEGQVFQIPLNLLDRAQLCYFDSL